jgi:hypothetical protein
VVTVSVIIPVWNAEEYLADAVRSVQSQTLSDWELLVVDDGSTDSSVAIAQEFAEHDARIRLIAGTHAGPGAARNAGMRHAVGRYLYFLDADDWIVSDALHTAVNCAKQHSADVVFFDSLGRTRPFLAPVRTLRQKRLAGKPLPGGDYLNAALRAECFRFSPCLQLLRREFVNAHALSFAEHPIAEDAPFTTQATINAQRVVYLPKGLFFRRLRAGSLTTGSSRITAIRGSLLSYLAIQTLAEDFHTTSATGQGLRQVGSKLWNYALHQFDRLPHQARTQLTPTHVIADDNALGTQFLRAAGKGQAKRRLSRWLSEMVRAQKAARPAQAGTNPG